jgi:hypothetical protein
LTSLWVWIDTRQPRSLATLTQSSVAFGLCDIGWRQISWARWVMPRRCWLRCERSSSWSSLPISASLPMTCLTSLAIATTSGSTLRPPGICIFGLTVSQSQAAVPGEAVPLVSTAIRKRCSRRAAKSGAQSWSKGSPPVTSAQRMPGPPVMRA